MLKQRFQIMGYRNLSLVLCRSNFWYITLRCVQSNVLCINILVHGKSTFFQSYYSTGSTKHVFTFLSRCSVFIDINYYYYKTYILNFFVNNTRNLSPLLKNIFVLIFECLNDVLFLLGYYKQRQI